MTPDDMKEIDELLTYLLADSHDAKKPAARRRKAGDVYMAVSTMKQEHKKLSDRVEELEAFKASCDETGQVPE